MEATKKERKAMLSLFVEFATLPFLVMSLTVVFALMSSSGVLSANALVGMVFSVAAIPLLAMHYFIVKAIQVYKPNKTKLPNRIEWAEVFGFSFSTVGFFFYLLSKSLLIGGVFAVSSVLSVALYMHAFLSVRRKG